MIVERIYEYARTQPQKQAIIVNGESITYLKFALHIEYLRKVWANHDLPVGSVAVVVSRNRLLGWSAILALQSLGLVTVAADAVDILIQLDLRRVSCMLMLNVPQDAQEAAVKHWPSALKLEFPRTVNGIVGQGSYINKPGGGHILYTSGTTGTYKKIFHDASLDHTRMQARLSEIGTDQASVFNITFYGPFTAAGYRRPLLSWACGATIVFDTRENWPFRLGEQGVTHVFLTPGALKKATDTLTEVVTESGPRWSFELSSAGGVTSASLIRLVHEQITPHLTLSFGCTEMWLNVMRTTAQEQDDDFWLQPTGLRNIDIVDDQNASCPDMVEGLMRIKLQSTDHSEYMDDPDTTSRMFREGWFYPGDVAMRRADGHIRVLGRAADVIIVRGNKMASAAIEEWLRETLGASAVCAFSGLMTDNEDHIVFVVETAVPIAPKTYRRLAEQLRTAIGEVSFVEMTSFPRTQTGTLKIDRMALRQQVMNRPPDQI